MIEHREETLSVELMCEVLDVSPSGYYAWCKRGISKHAQADTQLGKVIERFLCGCFTRDCACDVFPPEWC